MDPINWKRALVDPADILSGLKSIAGTTVWSHALTPDEWLPAEKFHEWAAVGVANPHALGWDMAVSYAKRAVCRRIGGGWHWWLATSVSACQTRPISAGVAWRGTSKCEWRAL